MQRSSHIIDITRNKLLIMKWILLSLSLFFFTKSFSQSEFETQDELIEYLSGVWNVDSLYGGWVGPQEIPSPFFADSAHVHFHFFKSDVPESPFGIRYYFNGELREESVINIEYEESPTFIGHWFLHVESPQFQLSFVIDESEYVPGPTDDLITLAEFAFDANSYYLSKCFPEFDIYGSPILRQYADEDGDGYGSIDSTLMVSCENLEGFSFEAGDCNDSDASINPNAEEVGGNDIDENCDGLLQTSNVEENEIAKLEIFPNPSSDNIYIRSSSEERYTVSLYSICGTLLYKCTSPSSINLEELPAASYIIKYVFENGKGSGISKIVKN